MRTHRLIRLTPSLLVLGIILLALPPQGRAQDNETPLGDVARNFRKKAAADAVIDNDNLPNVMKEAESRRAAGLSQPFSLEAQNKSIRVSSPDVTCSLSFSSKAASLLSDPVMLDELPRTELAKLDGPATIDGDSLQISMHNGTSWELREVVIGLTIVRRAQGDRAYSGQARIVPAVAGGSTQPAQDLSQKHADVTLLLHGKGAAAPSATAMIRAPLNFALFPDQEWHWAVVRAKGIPPQAPSETTTQP